jgi:flagellin-like protein
MKYNKGISGVITVLIIVLLALVAAGVVWVVISGTVEEAGGEVTGKTACLGINLNIKSAADCEAGSTECDVVVERKSGGDNLYGVRVIITDDASTLSGDAEEPMEILETTTINATGTALAGNATTAKVSALVSDGEGGYSICDPCDTYTYKY